MLIRLYWRDCTFRKKKWGAAPVDAFWLEATREEAETCVFPKLQPGSIAESKEMARSGEGKAAQKGSPVRPFCFLVTWDLSQIDPFPSTYPFHHMWNGYSPFREMRAVEIAALDDVREIVLTAEHAGDRV